MVYKNSIDTIKIVKFLIKRVACPVINKKPFITRKKGFVIFSNSVRI